MYRLNPLLAIDFYKSDHRRQSPKNTTLFYSNFTPRKSRVEGAEYMVFFGLQYAIQEYLQHRMQKYFFNRPVDDIAAEYKRRMDFALGKDSIETAHIEQLHKLGYLPLKIKALPEGTKVPFGTPDSFITERYPDVYYYNVSQIMKRRNV